MLLASAGVTVGLLGFALPASAATGPVNGSSTTQSTSTASKLPPVAGGSNSAGTDNKSGGTDSVQGTKHSSGPLDGNGHSRDKQDPCKSKRPEPCPTKPCRTEKPKKPCHSWTWHKPPHTVPCHKVEPCKPPKKRPCPPPVHKHHKKCDIRKNVT